MTSDVESKQNLLGSNVEPKQNPIGGPLNIAQKQDRTKENKRKKKWITYKNLFAVTTTQTPIQCTYTLPMKSKFATKKKNNNTENEKKTWNKT